MKVEGYERILKELLGKEKYEQLCKFTFEKIDERFKEQDIVNVTKIAYTNHLAILVIGLLKGKRKNQCEIIKTLQLEDTLSNKYLIEENINKFIELYSEYIGIIEKGNGE